jgi:hypothetical protein
MKLPLKLDRQWLRTVAIYIILSREEERRRPKNEKKGLVLAFIITKCQD